MFSYRKLPPKCLNGLLKIELVRILPQAIDEHFSLQMTLFSWYNFSIFLDGSIDNHFFKDMSPVEFTEKFILNFIKQGAQSAEFIGEHGLVHRDIKRK